MSLDKMNDVLDTDYEKGITLLNSKKQYNLCLQGYSDHPIEREFNMNSHNKMKKINQEIFEESDIFDRNLSSKEQTLRDIQKEQEEINEHDELTPGEKYQQLITHTEEKHYRYNKDKYFGKIIGEIKKLK